MKAKLGQMKLRMRGDEFANHLDQELTHSNYKGPDRKYLKLCKVSQVPNYATVVQKQQ